MARLGGAIVAPITAPGRSAVSLLRISGEHLGEYAPQLFSRSDQILARPREQVFSAILDQQGQKLDHGLVTFFKAPQSFTGEDCIEVGLHGSSYLVGAFLESAHTLGIRMAEPGEFSARAFENGRIDLTQAEAIADLIASETAAQARLAREQLEGRLSGALSDIGEPLRNTLAMLEANIDFPEEDIDPESYQEWAKTTSDVRSSIEALLSSYRSGRLYREGARVVLIGPPNAGKSSLLNRLLGEERAIVTPTAGTTRDSIGESIDLDGLPVLLWDTAGVREDTTEEVEQLGIRRSWELAQSADLIVSIRDSSLDSDDVGLLEQVKALSRPTLFVANKCDLGTAPRPGEIVLSAATGEGVDSFRQKLRELLIEHQGTGSVVLTNSRHYEALSNARMHLEAVQQGIKETRELELIAIDLRAALGALDDIIGVTHTEDILGRIFSTFCIGK